MAFNHSTIHNTCLSFLNEEEVAVILSCAESVSVACGEKLFEVGAVADQVYFILTGKVAVQKRTGFEDRTQVVGLLDPGAPVGEAGVLGEQKRGASVVAIVDSEFLSISLLEFNRLAEKHPEITIKLLRWLLSRSSLRLKKSSERLAHIL